MSEGRKRQIVKPSPPAGGAGEPRGRYEPPRENLLKRTVYIPVPMVIAGLVGIMLLSFSATWLALEWGSKSLDLAPNDKIEGFREAANETRLEVRAPPRARPGEAAFPSARVEVASYRTATPDVRLDPGGLETRVFSPSAAAAAAPPLARLASLETPATPPAIPGPLPIPDERKAGSGFTAALAITPPLVDLDPPTFSKAFEIPGAARLNQNLMARRYTRAVAAPGLNDIDAAKTFSLPGLSAEGHLALPAERVMPNPVQAAEKAAPPEVNLDPPSFRKAFDLPEAENFDQSLMTRRNAKATQNPQFPEGVDPLAVAAPGLGERERGFSGANAVREPVSELDLTRQTGVQPILRPGEPLRQRLMPRRYAKATLLPEQLTAPPPAAAPPEPILEDRALSGDAALEPWQRFAAAVPPGIEGKGRVVIIIDDMGNNPGMTERLAGLKGPLNFAFLPYAPNLARQTALARKGGHELLVHLPMEPTGDENPGPRALTTQLGDKELKDTLDWNLTRFEGFVGVNNHMGSRFTADNRRMDIVMKTLKERGLLFLDSVTTSNSKGPGLAESYNIPRASRDIFLDNVAEEAAILAQLKKVEALARSRGIAIAIGHPNRSTLRALEKWIPSLESKGLALVPLSSVVRQSAPRKLAGGQG